MASTIWISAVAGLLVGWMLGCLFGFVVGHEWANDQVGRITPPQPPGGDFVIKELPERMQVNE